ncbi:hypothetical protein P280DRAFT_473492 [Massarina eburnea CBS 473.64]|uniref:ABM domain-containing protein n=1 Tax=Massarina eburnea CBS 473.64 TaxID=1395130 RepID=A0A6A6RNU0_9PLEO|nr:hypothetical protein P280DRAFT_473492 [Massarina eburnea CBS 473.64]
MPVLEVTQLQLKGVTPSSPALLESLSIVRGILKTQSEFYSCIDDPTLIFILGLWPSLEAHAEFLSSTHAGEILGPQEAMLEFRWAVHVGLNDMTALPLEAPVLSLTRRTVNDGDVDAYKKATTKEEQAIISSSSHKVVSGWRLDAAEGSHEALLFSGWTSAQASAVFNASRQTEMHCDDHVATGGLYETLEVHHAWNLERSPTATLH